MGAMTEATMSDDEIDPLRRFRIKTLAHDYLLRAVVIRLTLLDPGFSRDARQWFDTLVGAFSASEHASDYSPEVIRTMREEYLRLLARVDEQVAIATAAPKPKSIRRRIFEWFERG
jgi:hypothetical protein